MTSYSFSPIQAVTASGPGALAGFECKCSCGTTIRSSLRTITESEAVAHAKWHERRK